MSTQRLTLERPNPFRRRRFLASHRRRSVVLSLLRQFLTAVLMVGLALTAGLWVASSPRFNLEEVRIVGTVRATSREVAAALAPLQGRHLLGLSLREVENRLRRNPWIEGATIRKQLPSRLEVEVRERRPVALLRRDSDLFYVDSSGFVIQPYQPSGPVDLLLLSTPGEATLDVEGALQVAAALSRGAPQWSAGLSEIEILGVEDFRIHTSALPFPVLVSTGRIESQLRELEQILPEILRRYEAVAAVDLRFSRQIVIQPAVHTRSQEG